MFKSSAIHLQWLGHDKNHSANNRTLIDSFTENHAAFLAKLRIGATFRAVVDSHTGSVLQISFRNGCFKGEASLSKPIEARIGDSVLVELLEKTIGRDGKLYLKTNCLKKLSGGHTDIICNNCSKIFNTIEQLSLHYEYGCTLSFCNLCGSTYKSKDEKHHTTRSCVNVSGPIIRRRKKKKNTAL